MTREEFIEESNKNLRENRVVGFHECLLEPNENISLGYER